MLGVQGVSGCASQVEQIALNFLVADREREDLQNQNNASSVKAGASTSSKHMYVQCRHGNPGHPYSPIPVLAWRRPIWRVESDVPRVQRSRREAAGEGSVSIRCAVIFHMLIAF